ncbi:hypothetical protein GMOD_00006199 [Pyrenophora seminiperda CCB06]|uniref:Uncharacterized protein n=1 Tax=Pyrenophora seminiperda CCB06 TaxID=1302712 RepID=A0A3M7M4T2_9PLEO|nr:hypothetical protein GMOD_00006199 [Pyrenophora seminiperda CCB06]
MNTNMIRSNVHMDGSSMNMCMSGYKSPSHASGKYLIHSLVLDYAFPTSYMVISTKSDFRYSRERSSKVKVSWPFAPLTGIAHAGLSRCVVSFKLTCTLGNLQMGLGWIVASSLTVGPGHRYRSRHQRHFRALWQIGESLRTFAYLWRAVSQALGVGSGEKRESWQNPRWAASHVHIVLLPLGRSSCGSLPQFHFLQLYLHNYCTGKSRSSTKGSTAFNSYFTLSSYFQVTGGCVAPPKLGYVADKQQQHITVMPAHLPLSLSGDSGSSNRTCLRVDEEYRQACGILLQLSLCYYHFVEALYHPKSSALVVYTSTLFCDPLDIFTSKLDFPAVFFGAAAMVARQKNHSTYRSINAADRCLPHNSYLADFAHPDPSHKKQSSDVRKYCGVARRKDTNLPSRSHVILAKLLTSSFTSYILHLRNGLYRFFNLIFELSIASSGVCRCLKCCHPDPLRLGTHTIHKPPWRCRPCVLFLEYDMRLPGIFDDFLVTLRMLQALRCLQDVAFILIRYTTYHSFSA